MGGYGSGRRMTFSKKDTVEDTYKLPISLFREHLAAARWWQGSIRWSRGERETGNISYVVEGSTAVRLLYTAAKGTDRERQYDYRVNITTTRPHFGGTRYWWECPHCRRRCGVLYGRGYYLCRQCHDLTYASCQEAHKWDGLYARLGWSRELGNRMARLMGEP